MIEFHYDITTQKFGALVFIISLHNGDNTLSKSIPNISARIFVGTVL